MGIRRGLGSSHGTKNKENIRKNNKIDWFVELPIYIYLCKTSSLLIKPLLYGIISRLFCL